eukprot:1419857-Amphidinium_carterae.1
MNYAIQLSFVFPIVVVPVGCTVRLYMPIAMDCVRGRQHLGFACVMMSLERYGVGDPLCFLLPFGTHTSLHVLVWAKAPEGHECGSHQQCLEPYGQMSNCLSCGMWTMMWYGSEEASEHVGASTMLDVLIHGFGRTISGLYNSDGLTLVATRAGGDAAPKDLGAADHVDHVG